MGLREVSLIPHPTYGPTIPHQAFMTFQMMFAAITPALITGAFAERMKFSAVVLFAGLWSLFVYAPVAHWMWGGGWLNELGALDFAGGAVVHISSGLSALVCALVLGTRHGYGSDYLAPHNLPMTLLGTGLLWFGWFGFNAGSALGANNIAVTAFLATHMAAAAGALTWTFVEWAHRGTPTVLGIASGAVAGLATVTPSAGYVGYGAALLIGLAAGGLSYAAINWKSRLGYDDFEFRDVLHVVVNHMRDIGAAELVHHFSMHGRHVGRQVDVLLGRELFHFLAGLLILCHHALSELLYGFALRPSCGQLTKRDFHLLSACRVCQKSPVVKDDGFLLRGYSTPRRRRDR